jgi:hypothetical protein
MIRIYLMCATLLAFASGDTWAQASSKAVYSAALKTAPGVVVRKAPPARIDVTRLGSFTPSFMDSSQIGRVGLPTGFMRGPSLSESLLGIGDETSLSFTPSGRTNDKGAFSLGVSARTREANRIIPTGSSSALSQNVGVTVGYGGFALEAGFNRSTQATKSLSQGMDVGLSYRGKDWKTGVMVSEAAIGVDIFGLPGVYAPESTRAVEFGAAVELTSWLAINGGLRYQIFSPKTLSFGGARVPSALDAGAVYLGTQVKF